ncbi:urease accessory protein UreE [Rhodophyticola sp. CCM32]|uniref:urease accessory protein UreE n=1 Tax=Rhodophyticola sp. CCM32 TaxID=2916397 RepID=UPI00107F6D84|nr:urease accessory protein UreE [Rhodophyticola sp. CCM32]QBX99771.1 urease accessory protein UreE [Rhodophyticola sp. CCM32]
MTAAHIHHRAGTWSGPAHDQLMLDYQSRFLRRKRLVTTSGAALMVDLAETVSFNHGDALETNLGRMIEICAAPESLLKVTGDLTRLAWHIGNRHTPCQIAADHLLIRADHVMAEMLKVLGAGTTPVMAPFTPEGGAYGHGRTHAHAH